MIKLVVTNRKTNAIQQYRLSQNTILFGRAANCDVVLDSETVSRRHIQLIVHKNLVEVEDLGSGNGTFVNQERIASKERVPLKSGDQIRIEEFVIDVESDAVSVAVPKAELAADFEITDPDILEIKMIKKILGAFDHDKRPGFVVVTTPFQHLRGYFEEDEEFIVGRDAPCSLRIDAQTVSRRHARLEKKWGGFTLVDLESKNGTFVNGEKVAEKTLADGDEVVFGTIKAIFKNPEEFDIDAISRTMVEEQQARDKMREAAALEGEEKRAKPAEAAKSPAETAGKDEKIAVEPPKTLAGEPAKKPDEKKTPAKKEPEAAADDILADLSGEKEKEEEKKESPKPAAGKTGGLSWGESALLAFGVVLLGTLAYALYFLLK